MPRSRLAARWAGYEAHLPPVVDGQRAAFKGLDLVIEEAGILQEISRPRSVAVIGGDRGWRPA